MLQGYKKYRYKQRGERGRTGAQRYQKGGYVVEHIPLFDGFKYYFPDSSGASEGTRLTILFGLG